MVTHRLFFRKGGRRCVPEQTYFEARERALLGARYDEVYRPQGEVRRALTRNALRCSEARHDPPAAAALAASLHLPTIPCHHE